MVGCEREIVGFRLRIGTVLAVRYSLRLFLAWTILLAIAVVLLRVSIAMDRQPLAWGLLGYAAFKEKVLPPAAVASLKQSRLAGVSVSDPTAAKPSGGSTAGALANAQAGGGAARAQVILPEHEKTVRRYFDRQKQ